MLDSLFEDLDLYLAQAPDIFKGNIQVSGNLASALLIRQLLGTDLRVVLED